MEAAKILKIPENQPGKIFTRGKFKDEYRELAFEWHPDRCKDPEASNVFAHIVKLYEHAKNQDAAGNWITPNEFWFYSDKGKQYCIRFRILYPFELGEMLVADNVVAYIIDPEHKELYDNGVRRIKALSFKDKVIEKRMKKLMPSIKAELRTREGKHVLVLEKTPDLLLVKDVLNHYKGYIDPRHSAWICSRLHNMLCYFQVHGLTHNAINLDTYFISPKHHSGVILGGWWYAKRKGEKLLGLPKDSYKLMTDTRRKKKTAYYELDSELLRLVGRSILGDPIGSRLLRNKSIPAPLVNWLRLSGSGNAIKDFRRWDEDVLFKSFGKKKFIKMKLTADMLYK